MMSLRNKYRVIHYLEKYKGEKADNDRYLAQLKREARNLLNNKDDDHNLHYSKDGEHLWYKEFEPQHFSDEELKEYEKAAWVSIASPYDCTGQWFTTDIRFLRTKQGTWMYHFMSLDV